MTVQSVVSEVTSGVAGVLVSSTRCLRFAVLATLVMLSLVALPSTASAATTTVNDAATGTSVDQFEYVGFWLTYVGGSGTYLDDDHYTDTAGSSYNVRFSGTRIAIYATVGPNMGRQAVSIDGGAETIVDAYASSRTDQKLLYTSPLMADGPHTLTVRVMGKRNKKSSGYYVNADRVDITAPDAAAPINTALPVVTGTAQEGQTVTSSTGEWSGSPTSYAYQWRRCDSAGSACANISAATASNYTLTSADAGSTLRSQVTATNANGSTSAMSEQTAVVEGAPPSSSSIVVNDATVGTSTNQFSYDGYWLTYVGGSGTYLGDDHYTDVPGASYSVRFSGAQIKIYATAGPNLGKQAISIDGGSETVVDAYAPSRTDQKLLYTSPTLADASHTLTVRVTGTKNSSSSGYYANADRVDITGDGPVASGFVQRTGSDLTLNGSRFRFTGFQHYGILGHDSTTCGDTPYNDGTVGSILTGIQGNKVLKIHGFQYFLHSKNTKDFTALRQLVTDAKSHNVRLIVSLMNHYSSDCDRGYNNPDAGAKKTAAFYQGEWRTTPWSTSIGFGGYGATFEQFVKDIVTEFANEPTIMAWQICAECAQHLQHEVGADDATTTKFFHDVAALIKSIDSNHLVSAGYASRSADAHLDPYAAFKLIHNSANIDLVDIPHDYTAYSAVPGTASLGNDGQQCSEAWQRDWMGGNTEYIRLANELGKPSYLGEFGVASDLTFPIWDGGSCIGPQGRQLDTRANGLVEKVGGYFGAHNNSLDGTIYWDMWARGGALESINPGDPFIARYDDYFLGG